MILHHHPPPLSAGVAASGQSMGFDFRQTENYVVDGPDGVFANWNIYPTVFTNDEGLSLTAGFSVLPDPPSRHNSDHISYIDVRLAGNVRSTTSSSFVCSLVAGESYELRWGMGHNSNPDADGFTYNNNTTVYDAISGGSPLFGGAITVNNLASNVSDIMGNERTPEQWVSEYESVFRTTGALPDNGANTGLRFSTAGGWWNFNHIHIRKIT